MSGSSNQRYSEVEWKTVIKAQDEVSKYIMTQEQEIKKKSMIKYKEELDKQLNQKQKNFLEQNDSLKEERSFLLEQSEIMKNFESKQKKNDRLIERFLLFSNRTEEDNKRKRYASYLEQERELEKKRINDSLEFDKKKKEERNELKNKLVAEQQKLIQESNRIKQQNFRDKAAEKERDKQMIEKNIEEMKVRELNYKNFYDKKLAVINQKSKIFSNVLEKDKKNQFLIEKRIEESEKFNNEKQLNKAKQDESSKRRAISDMRTELDRQIDDKYKKKILEFQENLREQEIAKNLAEIDKQKDFNKSEEKKKKMNELRSFLEKQLDEKQRGLEKYYMDPLEKLFNNKLINQASNQPVPFVAIPGIHNVEVPIKNSFERIFKEKNVADKDVRFREDFKSEESVSRSFDGFNARTKFKGIDLNKHDPIANPIGAVVPKILPGQRIPKGQSHSPFYRNASNILSKQ